MAAGTDAPNGVGASRVNPWPRLFALLALSLLAWWAFLAAPVPVVLAVVALAGVARLLGPRPVTLASPAEVG